MGTQSQYTIIHLLMHTLYYVYLLYIHHMCIICKYYEYKSNYRISVLLDLENEVKKQQQNNKNRYKTPKKGLCFYPQLYVYECTHMHIHMHTYTYSNNIMLSCLLKSYYGTADRRLHTI